eukprot:1158426-Pelagomonas_calceolata.AAC.20
MAVAGAECSLFPPCPPLLLNGYREFVLGTLFIGTTNVASGHLEVCFVCQGNDKGKMLGAGSVKRDDLRCQGSWRQGLPQDAFADTFKEDSESASNIVALGYHISHGGLFTS